MEHTDHQIKHRITEETTNNKKIQTRTERKFETLRTGYVQHTSPTESSFVCFLIRLIRIIVC